MLLKKAAAATVLSGVMAIGSAAAGGVAHAQAAPSSAAAASWHHYAWYTDEQTCFDTGFQIYISNPRVINYNCYYVDFKFEWDLELEY